MTLSVRAAQTFDRLIQSAQKDDWRGWDPYDALASAWIRRLTGSSRWGRIFWIQLLKRSPINLRPWLGIPKLENPKALALFASAAWQRSRHDPALTEIARQLLSRLSKTRVDFAPGAAWGYPFDWQSRAFYAPRQTPNVIVTTFAGHAFLDGFEKTQNPDYLTTASSACDFILQGLPRTTSPEGLCFSYTPLDSSRIHNANLLAAALLCRTGKLASAPRFSEAGLAAAAYTVSKQNPDGSWVYGEADNQQWIDSFHTGFNLMALYSILQSDQAPSLQTALDRGLRYYKDHFFSAEGKPYYFADGRGPVDVHSAAQAILTFTTIPSESPELRALAEKVLSWSYRYLYNESSGRFAFQKGPWIGNTTPFLRWSDAWMTRALANYLDH